MPYTYEYPRPMVTVDTLIIAVQEKPKILLIQRKYEPFKECWALPGGFVEIDETLEMAAIRELREETGVTINKLSQFTTIGTPGRDPRGRTISIVYYAFLAHAKELKANDDALNAEWFDLNKMPKLAFDHKSIINNFILQLPHHLRQYHKENRYKGNV